MSEMEYIEVYGILYPKMVPGNPAELGMWGQRRLRYLEEERTDLFGQLIASGNLWPHLLETDEIAQERSDTMEAEMKKAHGITEALKREDQLEWVGRMNLIRDEIRTALFSELVYTEIPETYLESLPYAGETPPPGWIPPSPEEIRRLEDMSDDDLPFS